MGRTICGGAPVEQLAGAHASAAWRLGLVAGADRAAATRAALHAVVTAAVKGGEAADPAAILALARSWAASSPGSGPEGVASGAVAAAFWDLPEPLRSALWCTDVLGLPPRDVERVAAVSPGAAAVARGRLRRRVCREQRATASGTACGPAAEVLGKVVAGHAPAKKRALVDAHAAACEECAELLAALRDPAAAVEAGLPPAPHLVAQASRAWRDHVGAPSHRSLPRTAAVVATDRTSRLVAAALAVLTAGSLGAATSQLASAYEGSEPPQTVAAPVRWARQPARPTVPKVVPQAVIPPLAPGVTLEPGVVPHLTPDLAQVAPVTVPPPLSPLPPPVPAPPAPAAAAVPPPLGEPPPATDQSRTVVLGVPLPMTLPLSFEVGPTCTSVTVGPLRLSLPCRR